jgi:hypothetical protein
MDDTFHFLRLQVPWQRGKPPVHYDGDGCIQASGTFAFGDEKAKEHAKTRRAVFYRNPPRCLTSLKHKLP